MEHAVAQQGRRSGSSGNSSAMTTSATAAVVAAEQAAAPAAAAAAKTQQSRQQSSSGGGSTHLDAVQHGTSRSGPAARGSISDSYSSNNSSLQEGAAAPTSMRSSMAGLARPVRTLAKLRRTLSSDLSMRSICTGRKHVVAEAVRQQQQAGRRAGVRGCPLRPCSSALGLTASAQPCLPVLLLCSTLQHGLDHSPRPPQQ